jgi:hypothetical protein
MCVKNCKEEDSRLYHRRGLYTHEFPIEGLQPSRKKAYSINFPDKGGVEADALQVKEGGVEAKKTPRPAHSSTPPLRFTLLPLGYKRLAVRKAYKPEGGRGYGGCADP